MKYTKINLYGIITCHIIVTRGFFVNGKNRYGNLFITRLHRKADLRQQIKKFYRDMSRTGKIRSRGYRGWLNEVY